MKRYRRTRLIANQRDPIDLLKQRLAPLFNGRTVTLAVNIPKRHGKCEKEKRYLALFAPASIYGGVTRAIVVSLIGKGSCILYLGTGKGIGELSKAGLPVRLATLLHEKLTELYGDNHGSKNTTSTRRARRPRKTSD